MLIRPSALGDVCRSVPVLASLRAAFPAARIDWLVQEGFEPAIEHHPALGRIVLFPRERVALGRLWSVEARRRLGAFRQQLAAAGYDTVIDAQGLGRSGLFAWWTRAPRRIGFANAQESAWLGYTERHRVARSLHSVERMLLLLERAGIRPERDMRLYTGPRERGAARDVAGDGPWCVMAPTSRWAGKRWPADRFAEVARSLLASRRDLSIVLVGASAERDQVGPLIDLAGSEPRVRDAVGSTPIGVLMALVEGASLVIANDSAAAHMAVGFDRPLVGLYGPTRVDLVGPYRRERDAIQARDPGPRNRHKDEAAGRAAMEAIPARRVIDAALERLAGPGRPR